MINENKIYPDTGSTADDSTSVGLADVVGGDAVCAAGVARVAVSAARAAPPPIPKDIAPETAKWLEWNPITQMYIFKKGYIGRVLTDEDVYACY